jgi:hypothetical protein
MSILALVAALVATALALVFVEVFAVVRQWSYRPSVLLRRLASALRHVFGRVGETLARLADVVSFFRHLVLLVRDLFFRFVPVEVVLQALRDLSEATGAVLKTPMEFFAGVYRGLVAAAMPLVATTTFFVASMVGVIVWETVTMLGGWEGARLSTWLAAAVAWMRTVAWSLGYGVTSLFTDLWGLLGRIVARLIAVPFPRVKEALEALLHSTHNVTLVLGDVRVGTLDALPPTWRDNAWLGFGAQVALVLVGLYVGYRLLVWAVTKFMVGSEAPAPAAVADGDEDDDHPPRPRPVRFADEDEPRPTRTRRVRDRPD